MKIGDEIKLSKTEKRLIGNTLQRVLGCTTGMEDLAIAKREYLKDMSDYVRETHPELEGFEFSIFGESKETVKISVYRREK